MSDSHKKKLKRGKKAKDKVLKKRAISREKTKVERELDRIRKKENKGYTIINDKHA